MRARQPRLPSVRGDDDPRGHTPDDPARACGSATPSTARAASRAAPRTSTSSSTCAPRDRGGRQQRAIEIAPQHRAAADAVGIPPRASARRCSPVTTMPSDRAARRAAPLDAQAPQHGQRAGIDRVAAQLVAREARAIEDGHARAGPCQHERRDRPRPGPPPRDDHVEQRHLAGHSSRDRADAQPLGQTRRPSTIALFFDPNPRQLQSAACDVDLRGRCSG